MNKLKFFGKFMVFLTILFLLWMPVYKLYFNMVVYASNLLFWILGYGMPLSIAEGPSRMEVFTTHLVPFIALVLATPNIQLKRMGKILLVGSLILFLSQVFIMVGYYIAIVQNSYLNHIITAFLTDAGVVVFPLALWFILAYKDVLPERKEGGKREGERDFIGFMKKLYGKEDQEDESKSINSTDLGK